tara:strand:- start:329 stop:1201 length:873 start_codon:yes stop_codon:yes gene_type:complete
MTDEIQPVDAGVGACLKFEALEVQSKWLLDEDNRKEWTESTLSASRKRILTTLFYGEAWEYVVYNICVHILNQITGFVRLYFINKHCSILCGKFDFRKVFEKTGGSLTVDGSDRELIRLEGAAKFEFDDNDAERDVNGNLPVNDVTEEPVVQPEAVQPGAEDEDEKEVEYFSEGEEGERSGGETDEEEGLECPEYEPPEGIDYFDNQPSEFPTDIDNEDRKNIVGRRVAILYEDGWLECTIVKIETDKRRKQVVGKYVIKFHTLPHIRDMDFQLLPKSKYGKYAQWVLLK